MLLVRSRRTESAENKTKLSQHVVPFALFLSADSPGPELAGSGRWAEDAPEEEEVSWLLDREMLQTANHAKHVTTSCLYGKYLSFDS